MRAASIAVLDAMKAAFPGSVVYAEIDGVSYQCLKRQAVDTQYENESGVMTTPAFRLTLETEKALWDRDAVRTVGLDGIEWQILGYPESGPGAYLLNVDCGRRLVQ